MYKIWIILISMCFVSLQDTYSSSLGSFKASKRFDNSKYSATTFLTKTSTVLQTTPTTTTFSTTESKSGSTYACALWTRYNNDDAPSVNGFSAGISFISNTTLYVGKAMYDGDRLPARVQITNSTIESTTWTIGGYVPHAHEIQVPYVEYLVVPDGCICSWMEPSIASSRYLIFTGDPKHYFVVGRKTFDDKRVGLTKVVAKAAHKKQCYNPTPTTGNCNELATELLVCETTTPTTAPPKVKFYPESCGMWSSIGMMNSAATNGYAAGLSVHTTNTAYVGRGQKGNFYIPGRYQVESPTGTYTTKNGFSLVDYGSEFLILPEGCKCTWMYPHQAKIRKGLITVPDQENNYMVGRKLFQNDLVSIMYVNNVYELNKEVTRGWYGESNNREASAIASEVLVCETFPKPSSNACALWTRYNNDNAPSINGFSAGISVVSNTSAYVGFGMHPIDTFPAPARVQIINSTVENTTYTIGGYVVHARETQVLFSEYLVVPNDCICSWLSPSIASNRPGIIFTGDISFGFGIGRKTFADGRVAITNVATLAKLPFYMQQRYNPTAHTEVINETATELLVCETNSSTADQPKIKFLSESCGMWSSIGMISSAETNGFSAGLSVFSNATFKSTAYVGRGYKSSQFLPGRYQVETPSGTYTPSGGYGLVDYGSQWLVVPEGCNCTWMTPDQAKIRKGLVTTPDQNHNFMIGRKIFPNGLVSVMHVKNVYGKESEVTFGWYENENKTECKDFAAEVLVCETLPPPLPACALWTRYNNDDAPSVNGFSAGISIVSNTTVYVGFGMYKNREWTQRGPARIQIVNSTIGNVTWTVGGYISYGNETQVTYVEYLVVPDGCICSWIAPSIASNRPGLILTGDIKYHLAVGRKTFTDGRVSLTKVITYAKLPWYMHAWYNPTSHTVVEMEPATELLVCETNSSVADRPLIKFASESCGMWSSIGMVDSAATTGFVAGQNIDRITVYVGRGHKGYYFLPGRYQNSSEVGTYVTFLSTEYFVDYGSQWLIVSKGCTCKWVTPNQGRARNALVTVPDPEHNYLIGRKTFLNKKISISHVNNANNSIPYSIQWYTNEDKVTVYDDATEVLICETFSDSLNGCALWTRFNNDDAPSINGFSAGISFKSNTTAYVGMGMYGNWRQPARIEITSPTGGYTIWSKEMKVNYPEYLVVPDGCTCSWIAPSIASNRAIILTGDPGVGFAVGRKMFADGRVAISKVITFAINSEYMQQCYNPTSDTEVTNEPATELLVCETNSSTADRPKIKLASESCGMWSTIGMENSAASNGFAVGQSIAKKTAYIGRGQKSNRFIPGRYEDDVGTFATFDGAEKLIDYGSQWLIVPQNCKCSWMSPDLTKDRKDLITIPDFLYNFMIGRKNLSNELVSISRVNFKNNDLQLYQQWYADLNKTEVSDIATEVLVCSKT